MTHHGHYAPWTAGDIWLDLVRCNEIVEVKNLVLPHGTSKAGFL